jgi:hypothetical protein
MRVIRKYHIESMMDPIVLMPRGAKILKLANKKLKPIIWAMVDTEKPIVKRLIRTFNTEEELPEEPGQYLGTVELLGYVFHCFDGGERA